MSTDLHATNEPNTLREAFLAAVKREGFGGSTSFVPAAIAAALSVVLPDETEQLGPATEYDYSRIQRQVERRAIKARFLELIDSLAVDRD